MEDQDLMKEIFLLEDFLSVMIGMILTMLVLCAGLVINFWYNYQTNIVKILKVFNENIFFLRAFLSISGCWGTPVGSTLKIFTLGESTTPLEWTMCIVPEMKTLS